MKTFLFLFHSGAFVQVGDVQIDFTRGSVDFSVLPSPSSSRAIRVAAWQHEDVLLIRVYGRRGPLVMALTIGQSWHVEMKVDEEGFPVALVPTT